MSVPAVTPASSPAARRAGAARWGAVALWAAVIFAASSLRGSAVPGRFGTLAHFIEYAVLAALLVFAVGRSPTTDSLLLATALASAYGVTDELHQAFVVLRVADPMDWVIDSAGALAGGLITLVNPRGLIGRARNREPRPARARQ